jgi:pantoate--beta-alanine ligase
MVKDTLLSHPTPESLHIIPTSRASDGLALSSRNVYLSQQERAHAPSLYAALLRGKELWDMGAHPQEVVRGADAVVEEARKAAAKDGVQIVLDYITLADSETFEIPDERVEGRAYLLCGAMKLGTTRMIDNVMLGEIKEVLY